MMGKRIGGVPASLALVAKCGNQWLRAWRFIPRRPQRQIDRRAADERVRRYDQFRYHLGRGRRAREAGRFEVGVAEARRALARYPANPWALALLGQCLQRQPARDLDGARRALERAWALNQTNGYFVGLLLDVMRAQGDVDAARSLVEWAWWRGAPVERWLPDGPPTSTSVPSLHAATDAERSAPYGSRRTTSSGRGAVPGSFLAGRQPVPA